jgi:5'-nucleotidase
VYYVKIILTNDDGIGAPGIDALEKILQNVGSLIVVAPKLPNSGVGHRVTTQSPIGIDEVGENRFCVEGTPADCSRIALTQIAQDADWLFAGINRGGNLGADVYMSGTVAAAREATLLGYRAISISQYVAKNREVNWNLAALRISPLLHRLIADGLSPGYFWNVNLPHPDSDELDLPVVFCSLDTEPHSVQYHKDGNQFVYAGDYHSRPRQPGRDVDICFGGKVAVTRIPLDLNQGATEDVFKKTKNHSIDG